MFGKMMNRFYYGKSGQGDFTEENLPTTRWQLFWEMLRIRLSGLTRLNLIYMIVWLPAMLVIMLTAMSALTMIASVETADMATLSETLRGTLMTTLLILVPCIAITGPATAGISYVTRNWARDEHAFIWSDFKDAVKANWKQSLAISTITGLMPFVTYICWVFYGNAAKTMPIMVVPQMLMIVIALLWALSVSYMHPMIVTYELKLSGVIRNSLLIAMAKLPLSLALRLLHCVPTILAVLAIFFWSPTYGVMLLFLWYVIFGFGLSRFITASFSNAFFDKYINAKLEGVQINRGLREETDDDDDFEDSEDGEPLA